MLSPTVSCFFQRYHASLRVMKATKGVKRPLSYCSNINRGLFSHMLVLNKRLPDFVTFLIQACKCLIIITLDFAGLICLRLLLLLYCKGNKNSLIVQENIEKKVRS